MSKLLSTLVAAAFAAGASVAFANAPSKGDAAKMDACKKMDAAKADDKMKAECKKLMDAAAKKK